MCFSHNKIAKFKRLSISEREMVHWFCKIIQLKVAANLQMNLLVLVSFPSFCSRVTRPQVGG